jgi:alpha-ketoglutarate-dependent taurine dioxygenase
MLPKEARRTINAEQDAAVDGPRRRQRSAAVSVAPDDGWVRWSTPDSGTLPVVCQPLFEGVRLAEWASACTARIGRSVLDHGAVLFRGFRVETVDAFEALAAAVSGEPFDYLERSSPRTRVANTVYTSTDYPSSEAILPHNENSYAQTWPLRMLFFCSVAPVHGGATPLADSRRVLRQIPDAVAERFRRLGVCYVRNYSPQLGLPWQTSFQTSDRAQVEDYCRSARMDLKWGPAESLQTKVVRPAIVAHPVTGEEVWFNQALLFHASSLPASFRESVSGSDDDWPTHATYGDGSPIEADTIEVIGAAYARETVRFDWRRDDVVLADNMLIAHGRDAFVGERRVLVSMRQPLSWADLRG